LDDLVATELAEGEGELGLARLEAAVGAVLAGAFIGGVGVGLAFVVGSSIGSGRLVSSTGTGVGRSLIGGISNRWRTNSTEASIVDV
jgi:hypothetical protein